MARHFHLDYQVITQIFLPTLLTGGSIIPRTTRRPDPKPQSSAVTEIERLKKMIAGK